MEIKGIIVDKPLKMWDGTVAFSVQTIENDIYKINYIGSLKLEKYTYVKIYLQEYTKASSYSVVDNITVL